jgi:hypothetical protein
MIQPPGWPCNLCICFICWMMKIILTTCQNYLNSSTRPITKFGGKIQKIFWTQPFDLSQILFHFVSFVNKMFRSARTSQLQFMNKWTFWFLYNRFYFTRFTFYFTKGSFFTVEKRKKLHWDQKRQVCSGRNRENGIIRFFSLRRIHTSVLRVIVARTNACEKMTS